MENHRAFLRWLFRGWYRDLTLWGMVTGMIGFLILALDGSLIAVWFLISLGMTLVLFDLTRSFLRFQYTLYTIERDRVARELERK